MGLAKKGSRRITVGGHTYRWVVSPDDGYMVLVAERATEQGQRLEAFFRYHDLYELDGPGALRVIGQHRSISPRVVQAVIEAALSRGWKPSQRGLAAFKVRDAEQLISVTDGGATDPGVALDQPQHPGSGER